jgi:epoxyqueuosine reductase
LDANRCISYWTIEHRGAVPAAVRPLLDDWVFGCDVCQEVCPWNAAPAATSDAALALPARRRTLGLVDLLAMSREQYESSFRRSPMKRAKRSGLRRNAAVAMGARRQPRYVPALAAALADADDPSVRAHAAWALGRIGGDEARKALQRALDLEETEEVSAEIRAALVG